MAACPAWLVWSPMAPMNESLERRSSSVALKYEVFVSVVLVSFHLIHSYEEEAVAVCTHVSRAKHTRSSDHVPLHASP